MSEKDKYLYGGRPAETKLAACVRGTLIRSFDSHIAFRVYHGDGECTDYDIRHDDLEVTIAENEQAAFYKIGEDDILDRSPEVLRLEKA